MTLEQLWNDTHSIKKCSSELGVSWNKVVKDLSSEGIVINDTHKMILNYHAEGKSADEIAEIMRLNVKTVKAYLPRVRPVYNENQSENALRIKKCRQKYM